MHFSYGYFKDWLTWPDLLKIIRIIDYSHTEEDIRLKHLRFLTRSLFFTFFDLIRFLFFNFSFYFNLNTHFMCHASVMENNLFRFVHPKHLLAHSNFVRVMLYLNSAILQIFHRLLTCSVVNQRCHIHDLKIRHCGTILYWLLLKHSFIPLFQSQVIWSIFCHPWKI